MTVLSNEPGDPTAELAKLIVDASSSSSSSDVHRIGFVTSTNPTRVQYSGDLAPLAHTPLSVVAVNVGDQVLTTTLARRIVILGVVNAAAGRGLVFYVPPAVLADTVCTTGLGFGDIAFTAQPGRQYRVTYWPPQTFGSTVGTIGVSIKYTINGSRPLGASANLRTMQSAVSRVSEGGPTPPVTALFTASGGIATPYRFLAWIAKLSGGGDLHATAATADVGPYWTVEDVGSTALIAGNTATANNGL